MVKLLIVADDFTGALDTGVQFKDSRTRVCVGAQCVNDETLWSSGIEVLVIDTETRHLPPAEAYTIVHSVVHRAVEKGVPYIYKKTDSALRGNIGSELAAVLDASGAQRLHFVPAFPQMGRVTIRGVHYVDGRPVSQSVFGHDPYEPVASSSVAEIVCSQTQHTVQCCTVPEPHRDGILVYDCASQERIETIVQILSAQDELHVLAGCAGLASAVSTHIQLTHDKKALPALTDDLMVVCGSINPLTERQIEVARLHGAACVSLSVREKLHTKWIDTAEGLRLIRDWQNRIEAARCAILQSVGDGEHPMTAEDTPNLAPCEVRTTISRVLGTICRQMMDNGLRRTLLVTGGDTLLALLNELQVTSLIPLGEVMRGVVCCRLQYRGQQYTLLSKSGGFGENDLILRLQEIIEEEIHHAAARNKREVNRNP